MATIVSRRRPNREINLAMSPPISTADDDSSPHLSTSQITIEKAYKSELPDPAMVKSNSGARLIPEPALGDGNSETFQAGATGVNVAESGEIPGAVGSNVSRDESEGYLPAHLLESSTESDARQNQTEEKSSASPDLSGCRLQKETVPIQDDAGHLSQADGNGKDGGATPTGHDVNRRIPSSSIPHLLSSSNSLSDARQLIQQQLSIVGVGIAAASPSNRSRDESFAFSVDGDDLAFKVYATSPHSIPSSHPRAYLEMNLKPGTVSPLISGASNVTSSISLASILSPSQNIHFTNTTPQHPSDFASPPEKVPLSSDGNLLENPLTTKSGLDMPQLHPPSSVSPDHASLNKGANADGVVPGAGLHLPRQPPMPNWRPLQPAVQPVLYSAINSLENYNVGSFDKKMILAKARGTYGKQKAFPGVPKKKTNQPSPSISGKEGSGSSTRGEVESKSSSVTSASAGRKGSRVGEGDKQRQACTADSSTQMEQIGVEQTVNLTDQPSGNKVYKSKSSGNLSENDWGRKSESLEELKSTRKNNNSIRSVTIKDQMPSSRRGSRRREKKVGVFRPSSDAYTPRMGNRAIKYKPAQERASVEKISSTMGTIQRPNFRDALRRVAIILHQHIVKIERRFSTGIRGEDDTGLFKASMREHFNEDNFVTPRYKCSMVRVPMARPGVVYSMRKIHTVYTTPTTDEIYEFAHQLFKKVQLSSECSIVCLIYVEKLMEVNKVPLVAETWRPIFMCGLLLASKVWQDLSSWNIEFASVYPQFSLDAINRLELSFLKFIKWDLYISSSLYAKYYFALRSLLEKSGFRDRYNQMVGGIGGIAASEALKVSKRSEAVKEEALLQLSRSM